MKIEPYEIYYKGYKMRSALEGKWAFFFDLILCNWTYEPQGYKLPGVGGYLPDFLLRKLIKISYDGGKTHMRLPTFFEAKGLLTEEAFRKCRALSDGLHMTVVMAVGAPGPDCMLYVFWDGHPELDREAVPMFSPASPFPNNEKTRRAAEKARAARFDKDEDLQKQLSDFRKARKFEKVKAVFEQWKIKDEELRVEWEKRKAERAKMREAKLIQLRYERRRRQAVKDDPQESKQLRLFEDDAPPPLHLLF